MLSGTGGLRQPEGRVDDPQPEQLIGVGEGPRRLDILEAIRRLPRRFPEERAPRLSSFRRPDRTPPRRRWWRSIHARRQDSAMIPRFTLAMSHLSWTGEGICVVQPLILVVASCCLGKQHEAFLPLDTSFDLLKEFRSALVQGRPQRSRIAHDGPPRVRSGETGGQSQGEGEDNDVVVCRGSRT